MACEHWKRCGDCHSPALVAGLREVEESLRRDVERMQEAMRAALDEASKLDGPRACRIAVLLTDALKEE